MPRTPMMHVANTEIRITTDRKLPGIAAPQVMTSYRQYIAIYFNVKTWVYRNCYHAFSNCNVFSGITDSNDQAMPTNKFRGRIAKRIGEAATWT